MRILAKTLAAKMAEEKPEQRNVNSFDGFASGTTTKKWSSSQCEKFLTITFVILLYITMFMASSIHIPIVYKKLYIYGGAETMHFLNNLPLSTVHTVPGTNSITNRYSGNSVSA